MLKSSTFLRNPVWFFQEADSIFYISFDIYSIVNLTICQWVMLTVLYLFNYLIFCIFSLRKNYNLFEIFMLLILNLIFWKSFPIMGKVIIKVFISDLIDQLKKNLIYLLFFLFFIISLLYSIFFPVILLLLYKASLSIILYGVATMDTPLIFYLLYFIIMQLIVAIIILLEDNPDKLNTFFYSFFLYFFLYFFFIGTGEFMGEVNIWGSFTKSLKYPINS